jgi:glycogen debranching enzyme
VASPPLIVFDGCTFFAGDASGDVTEPEGGFFYEDVRHLSRWNLSLRGLELTTLTSRRVDHFSARIVSIPEGRRPEGLSIRRDRFVTEGVHEDIEVQNASEERRRLRLELAVAADFADVMEAEQGDGPSGGRHWADLTPRTLTFWYERDGYRRGTAISFRRRGRLTRKGVVFDLDLAPGASWETCIDLHPIVDGKRRPVMLDCGSFGKPAPKFRVGVDAWLDGAPKLDAPLRPLQRTYEQSLLDLAALRIRPGDVHIKWAMPAGGLPWFMTIFGRDSLIASYEALPFRAELAESTLQALSELQATEWDNYRDAEPGKIPHELRRGTLAKTGAIPHSPYYGSHDATALYLILLDEYERWTGDTGLVRRLEPNARAALAWIEGPADLDGDGWLEYRKRSDGRNALDNQCWRDSADGVVWPDGRKVEAPIATCELQGYAYDARRRAARLAREVWGDAELAGRLDRDAADLKERFNREWWLSRERTFAFALDGEKRRVPTLVSNIGHLLWSGIVDDAKAKQLARHLVGGGLYSGWGIRTLAAGLPAYDPLGYHRGCVWPHDTAICAEGLRRYGFRSEASKLTRSLLDTAAAFDHQLPEVFAGFQRDGSGVTTEYPDALKPQAWAAGAPLLALRTLLGLDVVDGRLRSRPEIPDELGPIRLRGVEVRGARRDAPE